jgi:hypothetical protein
MLMTSRRTPTRRYDIGPSFEPAKALDMQKLLLAALITIAGSMMSASAPASAQSCRPEDTNCAAPRPSMDGSEIRIAAALTGSSSSRTGPYTASSKDCNTAIALAGTTFYQFNIAAPTTYSRYCTITVQNVDNHPASWRAKKLVVSGMSDRLLWPGQTIAYSNIAGTWTIIIEPGRWQPSYGVTFYVNADTGNDENDCLAGGSGACLTPAKAASLLYTTLDQRAVTAFVSIKLQDATAHYQGGVLVASHPVGADQIHFVGNTSTPAKVVMDVGCGQFGFGARDYGVWNVSGITLNGTCESAVLLHASQFGVGDCGPSMVFQGTRTSDFSVDFAAVNCAGALTINGGRAVAHINASNQARVDMASATVTITGNPRCTYFVVAADNAKVYTAQRYSGSYAEGCLQYSETRGAHTASTTTLPGSCAGLAYADSPLCENGSVLSNLSRGTQFPTCGTIASMAPFLAPVLVPDLAPVLAVANLSDYTAGSWTPTLVGSNKAGTPNYVVQMGSYEKIGRQVTARFTIQTSDLGGAQGNMYLGGLPVTAGGPVNDNGICTFSVFGGLILDWGRTMLAGVIGTGKDLVRIEQSGSGMDSQLVPVRNFANQTALSGVCHYRN